MASEMGVPFLGSVPIDVKFGEIVESKEIEGDTDSLDGEEEMQQAGEQQQQQQQQQPVQDNRLLVEKYQDCPSLPIFEGFAKTLLGKIEGSQS